MLLRVPVGMAMGLVGVTGFGYLVGGAPALKMVGQTSMRTVTDYTFGVIPMFLLMGAFVTNSGMSRELFRAANAFVGHLRGGLGIATIAACGGFAAICGSSVATAATFSTVAYPEMRRFGYPQSFRHRRDRRRRHARRHAAAVDRARGLRHHHRAGHRQAVHRRHHSGHCWPIAMYMATIAIIGWCGPSFLPRGPRAAVAGARGRPEATSGRRCCCSCS